ncbi:hypothetical protein [Blastococcus saxobsidens]|uniref:hypothetical protein n=1 Tax=Blastococcus saxobsidens TaxID=138336 RepID=UPI000CEBA763|nr:hypothetical protein [Blastococcus saxobsidens]
MGSVLSAAVLQLYTPSGDALPTGQGFVVAGATGAAVWVATALLSLVLPGRRGRGASVRTGPA